MQQRPRNQSANIALGLIFHLPLAGSDYWLAIYFISIRYKITRLFYWHHLVMWIYQWMFPRLQKPQLYYCIITLISLMMLHHYQNITNVKMRAWGLHRKWHCTMYNPNGEILDKWMTSTDTSWAWSTVVKAHLPKLDMVNHKWIVIVLPNLNDLGLGHPTNK